MISVRVRDSGISLRGHAGYSAIGSDIVCAAISALTLTLIEGLKEIARMDLESKEEAGNVSVRWQKLNDKGKVLVDSWFLGICQINNEYHCIQFL